MSEIFIVCGVSSSGKSTIGLLLANHLNCLFLEGDDYHPSENIEKMESKTPLTDKDRVGWIASIANHINHLGKGRLVLSCSALTPFVQSELRRLCKPRIHWIILELPQEVAVHRAKKRQHFMPPELIASQFEAWVPPSQGLRIDATQSRENILEIITNTLN